AISPVIARAQGRQMILEPSRDHHVVVVVDHNVAADGMLQSIVSRRCRSGLRRGEVADPRIAEALDDALRFMRVAVFDDQDLEVFESLSEARRERFPEHMRTAVGGDDYADERLSSAARDAVRQISVKGSILLDYL